jgi:hypothetical protein
MQGSCQCGGIRFEVAGPFRSLAFCHCTTCKKISGGVGTANGRARTDVIAVLEGRELSGRTAVTWLGRTPTSIQSATSPRSRN